MKLTEVRGDHIIKAIKLESCILERRVSDYCALLRCQMNDTMMKGAIGIKVNVMHD